MTRVRRAGRWLLRLAALALALLLALQLWYLGWVALWRWHNPAETAFMERERARLQARDERAQLRHQWQPYERISVHLKRAVVAAEDARFLEHEGVDWEALQKAFETNLKRGRPVTAYPGTSPHQMGRAVDIQTGGGTLPIYFWLQKNAARFGFVRTVPSEPWHYHYFPERDQELKR